MNRLGTEPIGAADFDRPPFDVDRRVRAQRWKRPAGTAQSGLGLCPARPAGGYVGHLFALRPASHAGQGTGGRRAMAGGARCRRWSSSGKRRSSRPSSRRSPPTRDIPCRNSTSTAPRSEGRAATGASSAADHLTEKGRLIVDAHVSLLCASLGATPPSRHSVHGQVFRRRATASPRHLPSSRRVLCSRRQRSCADEDRPRRAVGADQRPAVAGRGAFFQDPDFAWLTEIHQIEPGAILVLARRTRYPRDAPAPSRNTEAGAMGCRTRPLGAALERRTASTKVSRPTRSAAW